MCFVTEHQPEALNSDDGRSWQFTFTTLFYRVISTCWFKLALEIHSERRFIFQWAEKGDRGSRTQDEQLTVCTLARPLGAMTQGLHLRTHWWKCYHRVLPQNYINQGDGAGNHYHLRTWLCMKLLKTKGCYSTTPVNWEMLGGGRRGQFYCHSSAELSVLQQHSCFWPASDYTCLN